MTTDLEKGPAASGFRGPASSGFRWPAEWEPHAATWLAWPHNVDTWPGRLEAVESSFARIVRILSEVEGVRIVVQGATGAERVMRQLRTAGVSRDADVRCFEIPTDDAWIRDAGPVFLTREGTNAAELALVDFGFNAWGEKYPPWDRDNALPERIAEVLGVQRFEAGFVLEAGSVEGNGAGAVLTTESCLLNPNRGPRTRAEIEAGLARTLGATQVVWLASGLAGDDTDGHVDDLCRFVAPDVVVYALCDDPQDPNATVLRENHRRLAAARRADGGTFQLVALPSPQLRGADSTLLPASYANFYLANEVLLVPTFGLPEDARAAAILREVIPGRTLVPVPARDLVQGLGAIHCLTQQEPRLAAE